VAGARANVNGGIEGGGSGLAVKRRVLGGRSCSIDVLRPMGAKRRSDQGAATDLDVLRVQNVEIPPSLPAPSTFCTA
jgi:hypothetical protein